MDKFISEIEKLKKERNTLILAHNYQRPEIQDIADFVADSLALSQKANNTDAETIVFCGVDFMAETAAILNPDKKVLLPDLSAKCPMAMMLTVMDLINAKKRYPEADVVLYINSSAETKACADCICTSANCIEIVNSMDSDTILFGPDKNLAYYVNKKTDKKIISVPEYGVCSTHHQLSKDDVLKTMKKYPNAKLVVHPETIPEVQDLADKIASTEGIIEYCKNSDTDEFVIGTENGIIYKMKKLMPEKRFYFASQETVCPPMKMVTLEKLRNSLRDEKYIITVSDEIADRARKSIRRMLS
ncbi:MAG TPA: quinolinate synthase NadA [Candidatus Altiarchaeales archaeon]|nr:quinolinate synthase NadA [Candidatus Altiarchaeales archaeon]